MSVEFMLDWENAIQNVLNAIFVFSKVKKIKEAQRNGKLDELSANLTKACELHDRYMKGERTQQLYDEMSVDWGI